MPTLRRRNPRSGASPAPLRSSLADAAWQVEDRLVWGSAERIRGLGNAVSERTMYWGQPIRYAAVAAVGILVAAGVAIGIVVLAPSNDGGSTGGSTIASVAAPAAVSPAAGPTTATGPVLHGTKPSFAPEAGGGAPKAAAGKDAIISSNPRAQTGTVDSTATSTASSAQGGAAGQVAGPEAIKVARQFAGAFVLYETGRGSSSVVQTIFAKTATPDLSRALLKRPPRLPANVKVPKAKVLNIVPGPQHGGSYTLSISLLRVGVTSELRVEMQQGKDGRWQVTDVLG